MTQKRWQDHPLETFRGLRRWTQKENAIHFRISYSLYRRLVRGWSRPSWDAAEVWSKRSKGAFAPEEIMRWHRRFDRNAKAKP